MRITISAEMMNEEFNFNNDESYSCITLIGLSKFEQFDEALKKIARLNFSSDSSFILKDCQFSGESYLNRLKTFVDELNEKRSQNPVFFILTIEEQGLPLSDEDKDRLSTINRVSIFDPDRENVVPFRLKEEPWVGDVPRIDKEEKKGQQRLFGSCSFWSTASGAPCFYNPNPNA